MVHCSATQGNRTLSPEENTVGTPVSYTHLFIVESGVVHKVFVQQIQSSFLLVGKMPYRQLLVSFFCRIVFGVGPEAFDVLIGEMCIRDRGGDCFAIHYLIYNRLVLHPHGGCLGDSDAVLVLSLIHISLIGDRTEIGANAVILPDVIVGADCKIGAGAVVTRNIDSHTTVAGVPAMCIRDSPICIISVKDRG